MIRSVRADGTIESGGAFAPIERPRLTERIATAASRPVVLIVAPAGYGKSVALAQFLAASTQPHVLYSVRPNHSTLLGFLRGFADALQSIAPQARVTLPGAYERSAESQVTGRDLALWLDSHIEGFRGIIAIDDLHSAQDDIEVTRFLATLIERTKDRVQWFLGSRLGRGLPVGTWLAYGDCALPIDEYDLRFTVEEAVGLASALRLRVRNEELDELLRLTDGWATAMSFALRSATRSVDLRSATSNAREMIYQYLAEQVYGTLGDEERTFLASVALLESIDLDVLIAAGFDRAAVMLEDLHHRVAFLHDDGDGKYRCHDLFRDFILHELNAHGAGAIAAERRRLGRALEKVRRIPAALRIYTAAGAVSDIERLLRAHGFDLLATGHADGLHAALATLNAQAGARFSPVIMALRGVLLLAAGRYDEGEHQIVGALSGNVNVKLHATLTLRLAVSYVNRRVEAIALLEELLERKNVPVATKLEAQALLAVVLVRANQSVRARAQIDAVSARFNCVRDDELRAKILLRIGVAAFELGEREEARRFLTTSLELTERHDLWSLKARVSIILSNLTWMAEYDVAAGERYALGALSASTKAGDQFDRRTSLLALLGIATQRGDSERMAQLEIQVSELSANDAERAALVVESQAHRAAWEGNPAAAHRLFGSILHRQLHHHDRCTVEAWYTLCLALADKPRESAAVVASVQSWVAQSADGDIGLLYAELARLVCALAEVVAGRHTSAARMLKSPLLCDEPLATSFCACVEDLARAVISPRHRVVAIDARLDELRAFGLGCYARYFEIAQHYVEATWLQQGRPELTPAELSTLRSLAAGLAPKEIAAETGRSLLTVRSHIRRVIEKLECHGSDGAISAAARLGYLKLTR